jgi:hypothetical protein
VAIDDYVGVGDAVGVVKKRSIFVDENIDKPLPLTVLLELAHRVPLRVSLREVDDVVAAITITAAGACISGGHGHTAL